MPRFRGGRLRCEISSSICMLQYIFPTIDNWVSLHSLLLLSFALQHVYLISAVPKHISQCVSHHCESSISGYGFQALLAADVSSRFKSLILVTFAYSNATRNNEKGEYIIQPAELSRPLSAETLYFDSCFYLSHHFIRPLNEYST